MAGDYRIETDQLIKPIYTRSKVPSIYPIIRNLRASSKSVRYFKQLDDPQYSYGMEVDETLSHVGYTSVDTPTPVISSNFHWGVDELDRMNQSKIPVDDRLAIGHKIHIDGQERAALTGTTVALDDVAVTSVDVTTASTGNATAWTTAFNVTTHALCISTFESAIGQLLDGLEDIDPYPLALVVNPNVYKLIRGLVNSNTDLRTLNELNERMREINSASPGVISSKYLTATVTRSGPGQYTITAGTSNACLYAISPQFYRIHASVAEVRSAMHPIQGLHSQLVERYRPVYIEQAAIIYEDAVTVA